MQCNIKVYLAITIKYNSEIIKTNNYINDKYFLLFILM